MKKSLKIFLSSTIQDLAPEREIAARAIEALKLEALRAETIGSQPDTPADTCRAMVRECDVFVGIYGGRYGYVPPGQSVSVTEMEFVEARQTGKDILVYIKGDVVRDDKQAEFLGRADDFEGGYFRRPAFRTITELEEWIKEDVIALLSSRFVTKSQPPTDTQADAYRSYVTTLYGRISFAGLAQTSSGLELPLLDILVNARVRVIRENDQTSPKTLGVVEMLSQARRSVVVGAAGSGKTVLLKDLAMQGAQGVLKLGQATLLPVLVPLASWAPSIERTTSVDDFTDHIVKFVGSRAEPRFEPTIRESLRTGRALLLLDGLDEIDREDLRRAITGAVETFCDRHPSIAVVLTTRPVAGLKIPGFSTYELLPWNDEQVSQFAHSWSAALNAALHLSVEADAQARSLLAAVASHAGLHELARNPLFLTLLAFVHRQAYRLPTRRVELYDAFVATILGSWDRARSLSHTLPRRFEPAAVEHVLSSLALDMTMREHSVLDFGAAAATVGVAKASDASELLRLLSDLATQSAILTQRGPGQFSFSHRTFQEFFAAKAVAAMPDEDALAFITAHYFEPPFEEVIRLALAWIDVHGARKTLVAHAAEELLSVARG